MIWICNSLHEGEERKEGLTPLLNTCEVGISPSKEMGKAKRGADAPLKYPAGLVGIPQRRMVSDEVSYCPDSLRRDYCWFSLASLVLWSPPLLGAGTGSAWLWNSAISKSKGSERGKAPLKDSFSPLLIKGKLKRGEASLIIKSSPSP
jgi:hypothetical protein